MHRFNICSVFEVLLASFFASGEGFTAIVLRLIPLGENVDTFTVCLFCLVGFLDVFAKSGRVCVSSNAFESLTDWGPVKESLWGFGFVCGVGGRTIPGVEILRDFGLSGRDFCDPFVGSVIEGIISGTPDFGLLAISEVVGLEFFDFPVLSFGVPLWLMCVGLSFVEVFARLRGFGPSSGDLSFFGAWAEVVNLSRFPLADLVLSRPLCFPFGGGSPLGSISERWGLRASCFGIWSI